MMLNLTGKIALLSSCFASVLSNVSAQQEEPFSTGDPAVQLRTAVTFLEERPVIDGVLDRSLESLPVRHFAIVSKLPSEKTLPASFRLAYEAGFLYL
ncbi:MAG TPA: hypothetical protein VMH23_09430 [Bacteroidota bacterium]|nr:hypothetical protein [Bacteroidota bacterium]